MTTRQNTTQTIKQRASSRALLAASAILALVLPQGLSAGGVVNIPFNPLNFSNPLTINNPLLPMVPVTTQTYKAEGADGCEVDVVTVTNDTKAIAAGVTARVVHDVGYEDPECNGTLELHEETDDWFAQDNAGNVWYLGEDSKTCTPAGCTPSDGSWEAGVDGAVAGIIMLAHPKPGQQYYQEFYAGHAEDQAKITGVGVKVVLRREDAWPGSPFTGCLKTKEWSKLSPGDIEQKYYCPGIGNVAVDEHHGKLLRFELVDPSIALRFRTVR
jgi:hypothetical protein